jgi:probable HAF family extracellular repeat protein
VAGAALNESGQVTGTYVVANVQYAFLYNGGTTQTLGTLGGESSVGMSINASGQITGWSNTSGFEGQGGPDAYLYSNGVMQDLGTLPGGTSSYGKAINASGQVTGYAITSTDGADQQYHAFLYSDGYMRDLGTLSPGGSWGYAIGSSGEVTGTSIAASGATHAFLFRDGHMIDMNSLISSTDAALYTLVEGEAINDRGQIVVNATVNSTGYLIPLILTPTNANAASSE